MQFLKKLFARPEAGLPPTYSLPEGQLVYAVGDIHGRFDLLQDLLARIEEDRSRRWGVDACRIVFLGDYVDRGFQSRDVLHHLLTLSNEGNDILCLRGNHEDMMLGFIDDPVMYEGWLQYGGLATLASYGVAVNDTTTVGADLLATAARLKDALPEAHYHFLHGMPASHQIGDYVFVHAGLRPGVALADQTKADMWSIRHEFTEANHDFGVRVVHGHTGVQNPLLLPHRVAVDTIAYATGRLTAAAIQGETVDFLTT